MKLNFFNIIILVVIILVVLGLILWQMIKNKGSLESNHFATKIIIGQKLPGLRLSEELSGGMKYWDQVVDSEFGKLYYRQPQYRDTYIRWRTQPERITVTVDTDGVVQKIESIHQ